MTPATVAIVTVLSLAALIFGLSIMLAAYATETHTLTTNHGCHACLIDIDMLLTDTLTITNNSDDAFNIEIYKGSNQLHNATVIDTFSWQPPHEGTFHVAHTGTYEWATINVGTKQHGNEPTVVFDTFKVSHGLLNISGHVEHWFYSDILDVRVQTNTGPGHDHDDLFRIPLIDGRFLAGIEASSFEHADAITFGPHPAITIATRHIDFVESPPLVESDPADQLAELQAQYDALQARHDALSSDYDALRASLAALQELYDTLLTHFTPVDAQ